jgi:hypothetical protein
MTNTYKPYCRVWVLGAQALGGSQCSVVDGIGPGLDINGDHFTIVRRLHLCANRTLVDLIATPSRLFGRIARLLCRHDGTPGYTP